MADFWEQQLMDRILALYFKARETKEQSMLVQEVQDIMNYVKFLLKQEKEN